MLLEEPLSRCRDQVLVLVFLLIDGCGARWQLNVSRLGALVGGLNRIEDSLGGIELGRCCDVVGHD